MELHNSGLYRYAHIYSANNIGTQLVTLLLLFRTHLGPSYTCFPIISKYLLNYSMSLLSQSKPPQLLCTSIFVSTNLSFSFVYTSVCDIILFITIPIASPRNTHLVSSWQRPSSWSILLSNIIISYVCIACQVTFYGSTDCEQIRSRINNHWCRTFGHVGLCWLRTKQFCTQLTMAYALLILLRIYSQSVCPTSTT